MESETLEQMQARHRKEQRDLVSRITNKKKNATKKTRKGVNDECAQLESELKARQEEELRKLQGGDDGDNNDEQAQEPEEEQNAEEPTTVNDVTEQLQKTTVSDQSSKTSSPPPVEQSSSGGGKKRNRQKERLARRQAEIEAAAAAAEKEASSMVDHRGIEKAYMSREFKAHSLEEKDIEPDGHCLFSAVADQLVVHGLPVDGPLSKSKGTQTQEKLPPYRMVRHTAVDYMEKHADDFAPFLEEPFETYVAKIRDTAEWGGQLELTALANAYNVEIRVVQDGRTEVIQPNAVANGESNGDKEELKVLWLAYYRHGYGLGEHYNSLRKASA
ncbi:OTU protein [Neurospora sp. IMI 360204]|nr:OTU protein [Neurospora sp. IMI 360204]